MSDEREDLAGKLGNLDPGKDQKPAVVDDPRQVAFSSLITPTDPVLAGSHFQGGTGEKQAGENPVREGATANKVAELGSIGNLIAEVVIALDILAKKVSGIAFCDQIQFQRKAIGKGY